MFVGHLARHGKCIRAFAAVVFLMGIVLTSCAGAQPTPTPPATKAPAAATPAAATPPSAPATPAPKAATPAAAAQASDAASEKERVDKLIEGAKKEGKLVLYSSLNIDDAEKIIPKFEKKYPFIKVEHYRADGEKIVQKLVTEAKAGQNLADVVETNGFEVYYVFKEKLLQPYVSPESKAYSAGAKDKDGLWIADRMNSNVIAYNTNLVKKEDAPKSYQDLTDPKWKGKLGLEEAEIELFVSTVDIFGEQKALDIWKGIAKNQPSIRKGHTLLAELLAAGEFPVAVSVYGHRIEQLKKKGAPVEWVRTDPVIFDVQPTGILAKAPHLNAAKLWVDWFLSAEGQQAVADVGRIPVRPGVKVNPPALTEGFKIHYSNPAGAENYNKYADMFREIFGIK